MTEMESPLEDYTDGLRFHFDGFFDLATVMETGWRCSKGLKLREKKRKKKEKNVKRRRTRKQKKKARGREEGGLLRFLPPALSFFPLSYVSEREKGEGVEQGKAKTKKKTKKGEDPGSEKKKKTGVNGLRRGREK